MKSHDVERNSEKNAERKHVDIPVDILREIPEKRGNPEKNPNSQRIISGESRDKL